MGTRGCVGWTLDGKNYVETYNHYDSYPEGLGTEILEAIIKGSIDLAVLQDNITDITLVDDNTSKPSKEEIEQYLEYSDNPNGLKELDWYWLLRNVQGASKLTEIANGKLHHVIVNPGWMKDSLFCEFGYTLNFLTRKLEFWEGFQKKGQKGNPFGSRKPKDAEYYPCKRVGTISFRDLRLKPFEWCVEKMMSFYPKEK